MTTDTLARSCETSRTFSGVRLNAPQHWANRPVHAFHRWTDETTALTWCGIEANTAAGSVLTKDTITCTQCAEGSWKALR